MKKDDTPEVDNVAALATQIEATHGHEWLKVAFTPEEQTENAQALARVWPEVQRLEDERKSVNSHFKSEIEKKQAEANQLSTHVRDGYRYDNVPVLFTKDFRRGVFEKTRKDTGETYQSRLLTEDELQRTLKFPAKEE